MKTVLARSRPARVRDAQLGLHFPGFPARCVIPHLSGEHQAGAGGEINGISGEFQAESKTRKTCFSIPPSDPYAFHNSLSPNATKVLYCSSPGMRAKNSGKCSPNATLSGRKIYSVRSDPLGLFLHVGERRVRETSIQIVLMWEVISS